MAKRRDMEADYFTDADWFKWQFFSSRDDYKTSTEPQNIREMVKNTPLPSLIGNDDKFNLPLKQENDILSWEQ